MKKSLIYVSYCKERCLEFGLMSEYLNKPKEVYLKGYCICCFVLKKIIVCLFRISEQLFFSLFPSQLFIPLNILFHFYIILVIAYIFFS